MIIVKVELHSAITGKMTELARMHIINDGTGNFNKRNYILKSFRGRSKEQLDQQTVMKEGTLTNYPSERFHVWNLICFALAALGYTQGS